MKIIEGLIDEYESYRDEFDFSRNLCSIIFDSIVGKEDIDSDMYYAAKAYTPILTQIINKKVDYANIVIDGQIELLEFLNTFDDKYLSASEKLLGYQNCNEQIFLAELVDDINSLILFFKDFLSAILDNNEPTKTNLQIQLEEMLNEFNRKHNKGDELE